MTKNNKIWCKRNLLNFLIAEYVAQPTVFLYYSVIDFFFVFSSVTFLYMTLKLEYYWKNQIIYYTYISMLLNTSGICRVSRGP